MKNHNIKQILSNNKGITLIALIITIVVLFIIVAVSIDSGKDSINSSRLQNFYAKLEIVQKRVDDIATTNESYVDSNGNIVYLKEQGTTFGSLNGTQKNILYSECYGLNNVNPEDFKYFTNYQLETILGLSDIGYDVFVDFKTRTIIAEDGIEIDGIVYRLLNSTIYFVNQDTSKNEGTIGSLNFKIINYGKDYSNIGNNILNGIGNGVGTPSVKNYKITVTPSNTVGDLASGGTLKYKKATSKYWEVTDNLEFIISELTNYEVVYSDINKNEISVTIKVWTSNGEPRITVIQ